MTVLHWLCCSRDFLENLQSITINRYALKQHRDNTQGPMKKVAWVSGDLSVQHTLQCVRTARQLCASIGKRRNARLCAAQNERVNVMCALVGVHHFEVDQMTRHTKLIADAVAAHHVACHARNVQSFAA